MASRLTQIERVTATHPPASLTVARVTQFERVTIVALTKKRRTILTCPVGRIRRLKP